MEGRLLPINAIIGLVRGDGINPPLLRDYGYELAGLEISVKVPPKNPSGAVVPDVVIGNGESAHMMPIEAKSGRNVEEDQARRYQLLSGSDLVRASHIALDTRNSPEVEVVYACLGKQIDTICLGLEKAGVNFPVLAVDNHKIELHNKQYAKASLSEAFASAHPLKAPPARLLRWDDETQDEEIIRADVSAVLVKCQSWRMAEISIASLTEQANPYYSLFGIKAKKGLRDKVRKAARDLSAQFPSTFQVVPAPQNDHAAGLVRILRTPEDNDPRGRTHGYRALAGRRRQRRVSGHPGQEDLLRLIEEVASIGDTDGEDAADQDDAQGDDDG